MTRFFSTKNLLACEPDTNKRFVYRWPDDIKIAVFKASEPDAGWTKRDDAALAAYLAVLNADKPAKALRVYDDNDDRHRTSR